MFGPTSLKGMATARSLLERTIRVQSLQPIRVLLCHPPPNKSCRHLHLRLSTNRLRRRYIPPTMTRSIIRLTDQACTSTHHGSGSGSGTAPGSGMAPGLGTAPGSGTALGSGPAGISEGISLAGSVVLAEDMAEVGRIASAEDIAEGIGSFRLAIAQRPWCSFASLGSLTSSLSPQ
jgi:hypothetical protein